MVCVLGKHIKIFVCNTGRYCGFFASTSRRTIDGREERKINIARLNWYAWKGKKERCYWAKMYFWVFRQMFLLHTKQCHSFSLLAFFCKCEYFGVFTPSKMTFLTLCILLERTTCCLVLTGEVFVFEITGSVLIQYWHFAVGEIICSSRNAFKLLRENFSMKESPKYHLVDASTLMLHKGILFFSGWPEEGVEGEQLTTRTHSLFNAPKSSKN